MRSSGVLGVLLILVGLVLLYLLRGVLLQLIILVLGFIGIAIAFVLIVGGLVLVFWGSRGW
jgi:hypothetical protein